MCVTGKSGEWDFCHEEQLGLSGFWHWWAFAACFSSLRKGRTVHSQRSFHVWQQYARTFQRPRGIVLPQKYRRLHNCLGLRILFNTLFFSLTYSTIFASLQFRAGAGEAQMPCLSCVCLKRTAGTEVNSEALVRCQEVLTQCTSSILQYLHCVNILTARFDGRQNTFFRCLQLREPFTFFSNFILTYKSRKDVTQQ